MNSVAAGLLLLAVHFPCVGGEKDAARQEAERLFSVKVLPLLKEKCFACHGETKLGGLDITSREALLKGGASGQAGLVAGAPEKSRILAAILGSTPGLQMPPKENDRLTTGQVAWVRQWIARGAPWPSSDEIRRYQAEGWNSLEGVAVATSGGLSQEWTDRRYKEENLWAFRPVIRPELPPSAARNPIDAFHQARLRAAGITAAPRADRLTFIRRATYDLTGLPPTPEQVSEFLKDRSPEAWNNLIERLLASPRYGEQWARHWLDVVRYADTGGNSNDYERSNAWRYRDYVIRSFNKDLPFHQFILEQIAGDELRPDDPEMLVATGFLRMGPWGTAMVPKRIARQNYLDDVVDGIGRSFLSTPLRCAKCHDHKFDPIPTGDYYRIYSALATTQVAERPAAFLKGENLARFEEGRRHVTTMRQFATVHKEALEKKMEESARQWYSERGLPYIPAAKRRQLPDDQKPPRHYGLDHMEEGRLKVREQDEWIWTRALERYEPMAQSVFNGPDYIPPNERKLRMPDSIDSSWRPQNSIYLGGSVDAPGAKVTPGLLSAVAPPESWSLYDGLSGRRLALARWIADPKNPLSTRSIVNRIWQHHFGRGIAANPNNFGATGAKPTHPELLDWLVSGFTDQGWSIKTLHRLIMTSNLYQQAGWRPDMKAVQQKDPNNRLLAWFEPRRLAAEEMRDSLLAISGELNTEMGGVPAMPEINMEVALQPRMIQFSIAPAHQPSRTPAERNRRSIYTYRVRGQADPFLEVFNQPTPNESCERRESSSVSPQALTLINSDVATDRSIAFAVRVEKEAPGFDQRLERVFQLAYGRSPAPEERNSLSAYYKDMVSYHRTHEPKPITYPSRVTRSLVEEFSGKVFEYEERLPVFEDYVADRKASQVDASTRALADICLLLFNSNEFVFVY